MAAVTRSDAAQGRLKFIYRPEKICDTAVGVTSEKDLGSTLLTCPPALVAAVQCTLSEEAFPGLSTSAVEQLIEQTWTEFFGMQGRLHQLNLSCTLHRERHLYQQLQMKKPKQTIQPYHQHRQSFLLSLEKMLLLMVKYPLQQRYHFSLHYLALFVASLFVVFVEYGGITNRNRNDNTVV